MSGVARYEMEVASTTPIGGSTVVGSALKTTHIAPAMLAAAARLFEAVVLLVIGISVLGGGVSGGLVATLLLPLLTVFVATTLFKARGCYATSILGNPLKNAITLAFAWTVAVGAVAVIAFTLDVVPATNGTRLALFYFAGLVGLAAIRVALKFTLQSARRAGYLTRTAVIYGSGGSSEVLIAQLQNDPNSDIRICGVFDNRTDQRATTHIANLPCLGDMAALKTFARSTRVDMLILSLPLAAETRVTMLMQKVADLPIDIRLAANASTLRLHKRAYSYIGSVPVIDLSECPISGWNAFAKWLFDKTVALFAIVLLAPVMAVVALAVRLESKGPALFRQKRYGFNNELIEVYKFRSMYTDRSDAGAAKLVSKNDPRVTRVGRIIRKSSLDELPQLFNVLLGTLSLVGPRPHALQAKAADRLYPDVVDDYFARHKVKPGITGWAQINGWRGETDTSEKIQKRVEFDLEYIEKWSVVFDIIILLKTPLALLKTDNAY